MKSLLPAFIALMLLFGMFPGQTLLPVVGHHDQGAIADQSSDHQHSGKLPGFHCSVSSSCAPVFSTLSDVAMGENLSVLAKWDLDPGSVGSSHAPEKDPPAPRA
jgi:hypothetical protein